MIPTSTAQNKIHNASKVELTWRRNIFLKDFIKINLNHDQDFRNMGFKIFNFSTLPRLPAFSNLINNVKEQTGNLRKTISTDYH